jgi:hypothetical protein
MKKNDVLTVACDVLVLGSEALLAGLGALTAVGVLLVAIA